MFRSVLRLSFCFREKRNLKKERTRREKVESAYAQAVDDNDRICKKV